MRDWLAWWQLIGTIPAAIIGAWYRRRHNQPPPRGIPRPPLIDSIRRIIEANGELIYCESKVRGLRQVIAEMLEVMEQAGVARSEIRKFRESQQDGSHGATDSPFGSWPDVATPSPPASKTTPSSLPSSDTNEPPTSNASRSNP